MNCSLCGSTNADEALACAACGAALSRVAESSQGDALPAGTTLQNGGFRIDAVLGQGGFGITYRGFDLQLHRAVAIKEFFPFGCRRFPNLDVQPSQSLSPASYGAFKHRFVEEARVLARFKHPAIVDVYSVWEENNAAYMVMELLEGQTLETVLHQRNQPLEESEVLDLAARIGGALSEVHRRGLLHRDIKPANIVRCDDGRVMLIDFGTAREYSKDAQTMQGHSIIVTPGYAPLEQYAERATRGAYTDVYSLAATMYHLLTGEMPPAASDRALGVELRPAHELNPKVSPTVSAALGCAMETRVARRPQSVDEFLKMLHGQRAAALAPQFPTEQSSTRLAGATGEALELPQEAKVLDEGPNFRQRYEQAALEARKEWATLSQEEVIEARKQLLASLPLAPHAPSMGYSSKDALAASVMSRVDDSNLSLQPTSASGQSLLPPVGNSGIKVRTIPSPLRSASISLSIFGVISLVLLLNIVREMPSRDRSNEPIISTYNPPPLTMPTTEPAASAEEFLRSQNLEPQKPVAAKQLPGLKSGQVQWGSFSADAKRLVVVEPKSQRTHIYEVPSLRTICVLPVGGDNSFPKLSADGSLVALQSSTGIELWDARTGKRKFFWPLPLGISNSAFSFDVSPDGKFVLGIPSVSTAAVWSTETGKQIFKSQSPAISSPLAFTRDSKHWVSCYRDTSLSVAPEPHTTPWWPAPSETYRVQRHELRTEKTTPIVNLRVPGWVYDIQPLANNRLIVPVGDEAKVIDFQSPELSVQTISDLTPPAWRANTPVWPIPTIVPVTWSSDAQFALGLTDVYRRPSKFMTFIRKLDPKTLKPSGVVVLSTSSKRQTWGDTSLLPASAMFSPDNKLVHVLSDKGKLFTWRLDQLQWSK